MKCKNFKKMYALLSLAIVLLSLKSSIWCNTQSMHASWTVVGAGPTGILAVGIILDSGIPADKIVWIDPEFKAGRMGKCYQNVPGNGKVSQYIEFLNTCNVFGQVKSEAIDRLFNLPLEQTPKLKYLVDPLCDITNFVRTKVTALEDEIVALDFHDDQWHIKTNQVSFHSDNVVLATGAHPRMANYQGVEQIPLDVALDKDTLAACIGSEDTVAVVGDGHSALLIVKYLTELSPAFIVNFYKKPIVYPVPMKRGIAWQERGLKGDLAGWAKTVLEVNPPKNLLRLESSSESMQSWLPQCTKIIYAIGFERNDLPPINGDVQVYEKYDHATGVIGPRLFGVGIAFPVEQIDPLDNVEKLIGLPYLRFQALYDALGRNNE
ncbi:MAG: hypothetical protein P4L31_05550 [Candidatus Babeliales bacterium]|nr:hypothetical protein [Candidatus Babeliales bacterium]